MNPRRLFVASCIALVASAFSFVIRGDILPALGQTFNLSQTQRGDDPGPAFLGMAVAMFVGSFCRLVGMKRMLGLAFLCHLVGSVMTIGSPYSSPASTNGRLQGALDRDVPDRLRQRVRRDRDQPAGRDAVPDREDAPAQRPARLVARRPDARRPDLTRSS